MELNISSPSSRILVERSDNGIIAYEISEENVVTSKIVYETYFTDGIVDFESIATFVVNTLESLKIPLEETETNRKMVVVIAKIDPEKPALGEEPENKE